MRRENKFKIGDRVRCIDDSGTDCVKSGQEYDVAGVDGPYIYVREDGEEHGMYAYRFELVAPPLKIEAGKFYRTRDGRKVGPIMVAQGEHDPWPWKAASRMTTFYFKHDGFSCPGSAHLHRDEDDLIAEWQDMPSAPVAAQVDSIAEEYGPVVAASGPKFKVGDRVKAIKGTAILKVGDVYTVELVDGDEVFVDVGDEYGVLGYGAHYFEAAPPQQEPDTTLHIKFTSDFSELDAAILVRKKKLKKLIKLAAKAGIELREAA